MFRIEVTIPNLPVAVPPVALMAREVATRVGFSQSDAESIRMGVEEGCNYVLGRAFEAHERSDIRVMVELESRGLRIRIRDHGLPFDKDLLEKRLEEGSTLPRHLGVRLLRACMDEVSFRCLGREGNEINLFRHLKGQLPRIVMQEFSQPESSSETDALEIRRARAEEAVGISRCIYRSYGYTYTGSENVYRPEWLAEMNLNQTMISAVTLAGKEVVGHVALMRMETPRQVYDLGQAAVDPRYRSRGLLKSMMGHLLEQSEQLGVEIVYADPVTSHTHSQRAVAEFEFVEVGLLLASVGSQVQLRGGEDSKSRLSLLPSVKLISEPALLTIAIPEIYSQIVSDTLSRAGANFSQTTPANKECPTIISWGVRSLTETGFITVDEVGRDVVELLQRGVRNLLAERVAAIHLDFDLTDLGATQLCEAARSIGFSYGAVLPGLGRRLTLRMQYLNQQMVLPDELELFSEWGKELAEFVLQDRASVTL